MRIASPACWRGGAEAAMWFIAATRRRGPAGGTGNPAGGFWRLPDSVACLGRWPTSSPRSLLAGKPQKTSPFGKITEPWYYPAYPGTAHITPRAGGVLKTGDRAGKHTAGNHTLN